MQSIKTTFTTEIILKKSRFIGIIMPRTTEPEIVHTLNQLSLRYSDASHIVYSYRLKTANGFVSRFYDAGEPSGTAGKPIFQHLEGKDLINVLLVVIRYFGGIKLGAGGLMRAYGNTAKQVIDTATLWPYTEYSYKTINLAYNQLQAFEYFLKQLEGEITNQNFGESVDLAIKLPKANLNDFLQAYPVGPQ